METTALLPRPALNGGNHRLNQSNRNQTEAFYSLHYEQGEKVTPEKLEKLGYRFTARYANVGQEYKLFELRRNDSAQSAEVCFLAPSHRACFIAPGHKLLGVIVADPFHEHKARLRQNFSWL